MCYHFTCDLMHRDMYDLELGDECFIELQSLPVGPHTPGFNTSSNANSNSNLAGHSSAAAAGSGLPAASNPGGQSGAAQTSGAAVEPLPDKFSVHLLVRAPGGRAFASNQDVGAVAAALKSDPELWEQLQVGHCGLEKGGGKETEKRVTTPWGIS
jgi:hypothetical protein